MNWRIKSKGKGTRTIQYPVKLKVSKELKRTSGVDMIYIRMHQGHEQKHRINF
jgi:hypothetical protein